MSIAARRSTRYALSVMLTHEELYTSPDHYLHSFEGDDAVFVPMDRAAYHRSIFLDARISAAATGSMGIPVASLAKAVPIPRSTGWVFHIAHCGSTLLARALDRPNSSLVLREPAALRQVGVAPDAARLAVVLTMLGKRYLTDAPTIVKANVPVNFILPNVITTDPQASAIFLYCGLRDYLLAVLRSDGHRNWVQQVTAQFALQIGDMSGLSDAKRAAALWRAQIGAFNGAMARMPNARSLNCETFFDEPREALSAASSYFGLAMTQVDVDATVTGPLFSTSAKNPTLAFDNAQRMARRAYLEELMAPELDEAQIWLDQAGGSIKLDRPLV